jgi:hypothetical protein
MRTMMMMYRALLCVLALLSWSSTALATDCVALAVSRLGSAAQVDADAVLRFAATVDRGGPVGNGLLAALDARPADGAQRVRQILGLFDAAAARTQFDRLSQVAHVGRDGGFGDVVVNLAKSEPSARGAEAVLEWATLRMNPGDVARFEFAVPGSTRIADLVDRAGNLLEFKNLRWESYNAFTVRAEFTDALTQTREFILFAQGSGTTASLIFKQPIPDAFRGIYDDLAEQLLGDLANSPAFRVVEGF